MYIYIHMFMCTHTISFMSLQMVFATNEDYRVHFVQQHAGKLQVCTTKKNPRFS